VLEQDEEPFSNLNEIEVVDDKWIFANPYTSNGLLQIEISTGKVIKKWDLTAL
jgi:glutamine cyclotransferase